MKPALPIAVKYVINNAATNVWLFLNGTEGNSTCLQNPAASFTAYLNVSKTITLRSSADFVLQEARNIVYRQR